MEYLYLNLFPKVFKKIIPKEDMEITFLGTSQAIPTESRNHTAILLRYEDEMILFDCGEGTQRQFRKAHINPCKLTRILITHWHGDHILGLPGLIQTLALNNYNQTLHIYCPKGTSHYLDELLRIFAFVGKIKIEKHEINEEVFFESKKFQLEAYKMKHSVHSLAYVFKEKDKRRIDVDKLKKFKIPNGPLIGELQKGKDIDLNGKKIRADEITYEEKGKRVAVIMDTALIDECYEAAKDSDLLICESTYLSQDEDRANEYLHLTAEQAAQIAKKSNSKRLFLTHISQRYEHAPQLLLKEAKKIFKNTELAEDLMKIDV
jgi:ribonuclease Z